MRLIQQHRRFTLLFLVSLAFTHLTAQTSDNNSEEVFSSSIIALKTNLLFDATTTMNLGVEFKLSNKYTLDLSGNYNPWTFKNNMKWKHWLVQPELRYWFCQEWDGHFWGLHAHGGVFNIGGIKNSIRFLGTDFSQLSAHRFEGWLVGAGFTYGYSLPLSRNWNLEGLLGLGYAYLQFDKFRCENCGEKIGEGNHHYVGPTKAAINLIYVF